VKFLTTGAHHEVLPSIRGMSTESAAEFDALYRRLLDRYCTGDVVRLQTVVEIVWGCLLLVRSGRELNGSHRLRAGPSRRNSWTVGMRISLYSFIPNTLKLPGNASLGPGVSPWQMNMKHQDSAPKIVPDQIVEAAYLQIGELSDDQSRNHMERLFGRQPELLAFVTALSENLSDQGAELAVYMFVVVVHTFETHFGNRLQKVDRKLIKSTHKENMKMLDRLISADERWLERTAVAQSERQPWVWKYVVECLFDPDDPELRLTEEDQGSLAILMKTVIDVLDSSVR
jgi:hypothetical protein